MQNSFMVTSDARKDRTMNNSSQRFSLGFSIVADCVVVFVIKGQLSRTI